jgi:SAM-dependent methyltransferase
VSTKWDSYLDVYERTLSALREAPISMLEVGVQNGGSLEIWSKYFPQARHIVGCDVNPDCAKLAFDDPRIRVVVGNVNSREAFEAIRAACGQYDVILDDGSHYPRDIIFAFLNYFPALKPGGVYIAEDLHCSYWPKWGGGVLKQNSAYAFFKLLVDIINQEHWQSDVSPEALFSTILDAGEFPPYLKEGIVESVEFHNSMAIVRRAPVPGARKLGAELIVGTDASIVPKVLDARKPQ